jgi:putative aldouronate transport system substrate-binding protein
MASEESIVLREWGIEGVHYDIVNGVRVEKPEVRQANLTDPDYGNNQGFDWAYPFPQQGNGVLDSTGSPFTKKDTTTIREEYWPSEVEALAAYGGQLWMDLFPATSSFSLPKAGAAWQILIPTDSQLNDIVSMIQSTLLPRMVPQAIMAAPGDFDAKWDEFIAAVYDAGAEQAGAEMTELLRGKGRLWGTYP